MLYKERIFEKMEKEIGIKIKIKKRKEKKK